MGAANALGASRGGEARIESEAHVPGAVKGLAEVGGLSQPGDEGKRIA
jgi:hypothetical protein